MKRMMTILATGGLVMISATGLTLAGGTHGTGGTEQGHTEGAGMMPGSIDEAREMHKAHEHGHDFEAIEEMSPERMNRVMALMSDIGVATPPMDAQRGREVFVQKGCVACHSVNGVGGDLGPALNAEGRDGTRDPDDRQHIEDVAADDVAEANLGVPLARAHDARKRGRRCVGC